MNRDAVAKLTEAQKIAHIMALQSHIHDLESQLHHQDHDHIVLNTEALEREKVAFVNRFVKDASHEFRTPLTVINTAAHLLRKIKDTAKQEKYVSQIEQEVSKLLTLLEDLLTVTALEEAITLQLEKVRVSTLIKQVMSNAESHALKRGIALVLNAPADLPLMDGDAIYLSRMFDELLANAIAFSHTQGAVTVEVDVIDDHMIVIFQDNGIGMTERDIARIFERFYRKDNARTTSGFGLGLSIARKIIELHDGSIAIDSELDKGTCVKVTLPIAAG